MIHPITMGRLTELLRMENHAVAIYRTDRIPEGAHVPGTHCIIPPLLVRCSNLGHMCATDNEHAACHGSKSGLGFGGVANRQRSAWSASVVPESIQETMKHKSSGQSLFKTPEIALIQMEAVKDYGDGNDVIVFQDLDEAESQNKPIEVVVFLTDPARITALMQLAAFSKETPGPSVIMPTGHACQQIYAIPRAEGESDDPHAVLGMTDMYARRYIGKDQMSFAVPYKLYKRMVSDIDDSFLMKEKFIENMEKCL